MHSHPHAFPWLRGRDREGLVLANRRNFLKASLAGFAGLSLPNLPPYVTFMKSRTHLAFSGYLGKQYDPLIADAAAQLPIYTNVGVDTGRTTPGNLFKLPRGINQEQIQERRTLVQAFDTLRHE